MTLDESKAPICLFLRGGLGNQLLQFAYIHYLANASKRRYSLYYSQPLLDNIWSILRYNTVRKIVPLVGLAANFSKYDPTWQSVLRILPSISCLRLLTESGTVIEHMTVLDSQRTIPVFLGYFHRTECFSPSTHSFWLKIYEVFRSSYPMTPCTTNNTAMHIRLGDYLNKKNSHIYSAFSINDQVSRCLSYCPYQTADRKVDIFTDDPAFVAHQLERQYHPYINIRSPKDPIEDLITLASYRLIWASNSTFSLCAGRISSLIHNTQTLVLPRRWFVSDSRNSIEMNKWRALDFVSLLNPL